jgi:hypothetical protein
VRGDQVANARPLDRRVAAGLESRIALLGAAVHPALALAGVRRARAGAWLAAAAGARLRAALRAIDGGRLSHVTAQ